MSTFISLASAPFLVATAFLTVLGIYRIRTDEAFGDIAGNMLLAAVAGSLWLGCVLLGLSRIIDQLDDLRVGPTRDRHEQTASAWREQWLRLVAWLLRSVHTSHVPMRNMDIGTWRMGPLHLA